MKTVCLFCASLNGKDPLYSEVAKDFGSVLSKHKYSLLYGGGASWVNG